MTELNWADCGEMALCEIRLPTFRRPDYLRRALNSVLGQTYPDWRCIVFDDCPNGSAKPIVDGMRDDRFDYRRNSLVLGAIGNIDKCFRNTPFAGGKFACVLEDDNYLLPTHVEVQIEICRRLGVDVTFSAQLVEEIVSPGKPGRIGNGKTLAWIFPEGKYRWRDVLPAVLFSHAFSNGAAFWLLGCASDFEIGNVTKFPGIQETLRMLKLRDDVFISHHATSVWRSNDPRDSYVSHATESGVLAKLKSRLGTLAVRREMNDYRKWYVKNFGCGDAFRFADELSPVHKESIERGILLTGRHVVMTGRSTGWRLFQLSRSYVFSAIIQRRLDLRNFRSTC